MSIGFLLGVAGGSARPRAPLPHWRSHEYERRRELTRGERLRRRIEVWREVDPAHARALGTILKTWKPQ